MSDKKNEITDEEMKAATGGAKYTISSTKSVPHGTYPSGGEGTDPGGTGNTDPVYGELPDGKLGGVRGGTNTTPGSAVKSDFYRDNDPSSVEAKRDGNTPDRDAMGGQVK
jgi:hypothetical protein